VILSFVRWSMHQRTCSSQNVYLPCEKPRGGTGKGRRTRWGSTSRIYIGRPTYPASSEPAKSLPSIRGFLYGQTCFHIYGRKSGCRNGVFPDRGGFRLDRAKMKVGSVPGRFHDQAVLGIGRGGLFHSVFIPGSTSQEVI